MAAVRITSQEFVEFISKHNFVADQLPGYNEDTYSRTLYSIRSKRTGVTKILTEKGARVIFKDFDRVLDGSNDGVECRTFKLFTASTIENGISRELGKDAIRLFFMAENSEGKLVPIGKSTRTHRMANWRTHLANKINDWKNMLGPCCNKCGSPTVLKKPKGRQTWKEFYGCIEYGKACQAKAA